jgi:hypothetical protein
MVSYHRELEYVSCVWTGLGSERSAKGCERIKPIDRTAKRCVPYFTVYQIVIIAGLRSASGGINAGLSAAAAFHCASSGVKNSTGADGELNRRKFIRVEWNHRIVKTSLAIGDCCRGFSISGRSLAVTAECQTKNNHHGRKQERQAKRGSHVVSLNFRVAGALTQYAYSGQLCNSKSLK